MRSNKIVPLLRTEYANTGGRIFGTVFTDPAGTEPFAAQMVSRGLVHPAKFKLPPSLMAAIATVGLEMGDSGAYLAIEGIGSGDETSGPGQSPFPDHWWLPLSRIQDYQGLRGAHLVVENVLFSESGQWGVAAILDGAALLGGRDDFATRVMDRLAVSQDSQVESFYRELLLDRADAPPGYVLPLNIPFVKGLFTHLFGPGTATRYLATWT